MFALACVILFAAVTVYFTDAAQRPADASPPRPTHPARASCVEIVLARLFACPDGRVYSVERDTWKFVGPLHPIPPVPHG